MTRRATFKVITDRPRYERGPNGSVLGIPATSDPFTIEKWIWDSPEKNPRVEPCFLGQRPGAMEDWDGEWPAPGNCYLYRDRVYESILNLDEVQELRADSEEEHDLARFVDRPPPPTVRKVGDAAVDVGDTMVVVTSAALAEPYRLGRSQWDDPNGPRWLPHHLWELVRKVGDEEPVWHLTATLKPRSEPMTRDELHAEYQNEIHDEELWLYGHSLYAASCSPKYGKNEPEEIRDLIENPSPRGREPIPRDVQQFVWQRDGGACVQCGSRERLEFDHIIPLSQGGSNTARNLQLLCESCNRTKSNRIG